MPTPKQIAASRANGALSKGPVSIQGKGNSSRNSFRHGLLARTVVLEEESTPRFLELLESLLEEFHPATPTQFLLVETMAVARWRLLRTWGLQKVALDREIALQSHQAQQQTEPYHRSSLPAQTRREPEPSEQPSPTEQTPQSLNSRPFAAKHFSSNEPNNPLIPYTRPGSPSGPALP